MTIACCALTDLHLNYETGNRSALDWIIDQYQVKTDKRSSAEDSGITSDPNHYSEDEQYIVKLIERVTHLSVETVKIVATLAAYPLPGITDADSQGG